MPFTFIQASIEGLVIVQPQKFDDSRGFFLESYKNSDFIKAGIPASFVQDNHSCSVKGVLRGLHYQCEPHAQGKLVRVTKGRVWDVAVDIRIDSPSFGRWFAVELSADNQKMLYIPSGFAHGFLTLEDRSELQYKCTAEYNAGADAGIRWDDPDLAIQWPMQDVIISGLLKNR